MDPTYIHCPFCGWHRMKDTAKTNAVEWDYASVVARLVLHVDGEHHDRWVEFLNEWNNHAREGITA